MNIYIKNLILALIAIVTLGMTSCSEDKLGDTIFPATEEDLDQTSYTYPLDAYLRDSFLIPYNVQFIYKMEDVGTTTSKFRSTRCPSSYVLGHILKFILMTWNLPTTWILRKQ